MTFCGDDPSKYHCLEDQAGELTEICIRPTYIERGMVYIYIFTGTQSTETHSDRMIRNGVWLKEMTIKIPKLKQAIILVLKTKFLGLSFSII